MTDQKKCMDADMCVMLLTDNLKVDSSYSYLVTFVDYNEIEITSASECVNVLPTMWCFY
jgi:DNA polymerase II large subunit